VDVTLEHPFSDQRSTNGQEAMNMSEENGSALHDDHLSEKHDDPLVRGLHRVIRQAIRLLAVLMTMVILWCVADVVLVLYNALSKPPVLLLDLNDIFVVFAAFLAVLIAIEILVNITLYLRDDVIHVQLVVATALMAIARKVIVLDLSTLQAEYLYGMAAILLALGVTYWLVSSQPKK
jgi:uncharacterized membrane protein (DUF373 family)